MKHLHKEMIEKFQISARNCGIVNKWGGKRYQYKIKIGPKEFDYYDSINNYKLGVKKLDNKALLFAFSAILQDALSYIQYEDNIIDFAKDFGYIDNKSQPNFEFYLNSNYRGELNEYLTDKEIENFRNIKIAYSGCKDTYYALERVESINLNLRYLKEDRLYEILENLREMGIE
jgi:hypothetical protein